MRILVGMANLHSPHFHACGITGKNMGERLDASRDAQLTMVYDRETKELEVTWQGKTAFVPESNVKAYYELEDKTGPKEVRKVVGAVKAQVSTPQDHVFAGPGGGKVK